MKKRIVSLLLTAVMVFSLFPVTASADTTPTVPDPADTIKAHRDVSDEEIYYLTRCDSSSASNLQTGTEIAWLDESYTEEEYTSIGVPSGSAIIKVVEKPDPEDWVPYYPVNVDYYLDVLKSGKGFDTCPHGTLNNNVTEYNCFYGGVQHLKGKAFTFISKPIYSKVTFHLNINGAPASGHIVQLYDGNRKGNDSLFELTDKGNGVYASSKIFVGDYSIYVDGEPANIGVSVVKPSDENEGYLCDVNDDGEYIRNNDRAAATAYYSGHNYEAAGNFYDYNITVTSDGITSDALGNVTFVADNRAYSLVKTDTGTYEGTLSLPIDITSEDISIYVGGMKTSTIFQTETNQGESYNNKNIVISFYTAKVKALLDDAPMSGYTVSFNNGVSQYFGKTNASGIVELPVQIMSDGTAELPYTVKIDSVVDNTGTPITLSSTENDITLDYHALSFFTGEKGEETLFRKQVVRDGSLPNKVANAPLDGYVFDFWSEAQWEKDEDPDEVEKYNFTPQITASKNVYAHATKPTLDIYGTYIGTDIRGTINTTDPEAFRMPAVTITGFPKGDVLKCFNLELTNVDKVYFYDTDGLTIQQPGSAAPTEEENGGKSTTSSKVTVSFPDKASMTTVENYIRENVVFAPKAGQTVTIKLTVSDDIISVEDTSTIKQNQCTAEAWTKLESSSTGQTLESGKYYIDSNVTITGTVVTTYPITTQPGITIDGTVYLYIPSGKTLTVKGADAYTYSESSGYAGAAGILLLENNMLYVYGGGTLNVTGGNAENGKNGGNASRTFDDSGKTATQSSGRGGRGGAGAGAGIGTNGAKDGGLTSEQKETISYSGNIAYYKNGNKGNDGRSVSDKMGTLYIADTIIRSVSGGAAGNGGQGGSRIEFYSTTKNSAKQIFGITGGGGGGAGGQAGAAIGQGGGSGGQGGNGGLGYLGHYEQCTTADNTPGGGGGKGAIGATTAQNGKDGNGKTRTMDNDKDGGAAGTSGTGGAIGTVLTPTSVPDALQYTITFDGAAGQAEYSYGAGEGLTIQSVPDYTNVPTGMQFMGWKVKTYGKTLETASADNPLTTAENVLYQPNSTLTINPGTYGDIVMAPITAPLPKNAASDSLTLTASGAPQSYEYTLKVTKNGQAADLGTFVFHGSNGNDYKVKSGTGDKLGTYTLTLAKDIAISSISAIDLNNITIKDGTSDLSIGANETKAAAFVSMEVAVTGKTVGEVVAKDSSYTLAYDNGLSTDDMSVFSCFTQASSDSGEYTIVIDGEEVPTVIAKAEFGTRATVAYSTVNVSVTTNVTDVLSLCLKADGHEPITLIESGTKYTATVFSDDATEYTLYINDHPSGVTCTLKEVTVEKSAEYYEVKVVSKVDGAEKPTDHTILVGGARPATVDNTTFTAFAFSENPLAVTSNGETVATVTPSTTLGNTHINYYTVSYNIAGCTGTAPVDSTLYLAGQEATVASTEGLSASAENSYAAGWQLDDKVYNEGDTVEVTGTLTLTALVKPEDLIIHYVDHFGEVGTVKRLPLTEKITIAEMQDLHSFFTDGLVEYSFKGWTLDEDTNKKVYKIYEETDFTPQGLLGGTATKEVTFRAVYDVEYLNGITIEATLPEGKTVQGINQVGQTFTINYKISGNDGGINKLVLIPAYDSENFAIDSVTPVNTTGLGTGTVTGPDNGKYKVAFDSNDLYNSTGEIIVSITYRVTKLASGDHDFGFVLNYAEDTLNDITFDNRSYAYRNPVTSTGSLDPSQEVKITFDGSKIKARTLENTEITIAEGQSVAYSGNKVTIGLEDEASDLHFHYGGYDKQEDCVQNAAEFTYTWYDKDGQPLNDAPKDAGTYSVGVSASASDYYNAVTEVKQTFTISKTAKPAATPVDYEVNAVLYKTLSLETIGITLQGAKITKVEAVSGKTSEVLNGAPTIDSGDTSIGWTTVDQPSGKVNDQYTLTVSSDNYNDFTVTVSFKGKIPVTVSATGEDFVYGDADKTGYTGLSVKKDLVDVAALEFLYESTGTTATYSSANVPTDVGTYKVTISVPDSNTTYIGSTTVEFAITQQGVPVPAENKTVFIYDGAEKSYITVEDDALYKLADDSAATSRTDAGTTTIKLVLKDAHNYKWANGAADPSYTFTIAQEEIVINWVEDDFTYNGENQTASITASYKNVDGTSHSLIIAVKQSGDVKDFQNAGAYTAEVTGFDTANDPGSKNYALPETVTKDYTMKQKPVKVLDVTVQDKTYNGETEDAAFTGAAVFEGLCEGDTLTLSNVTGEYTSPNAGSQKVTLSGTWALSDNNYKLAEHGHATYAFGKIGKANQAAPTAPAVSGSTVTIATADRTKKLEYCVDDDGADDKKAWISVPTLNGNGAFTLSGLAAGDHTVYLRVKESGNYFASSSVNTVFTLTQYSVAYNANGGIGSIASQTATAPATLTVASGSAMNRTGYTFTGWKDEAGIDHAVGSTVNTGMMLYAQWTANTYTVRFNANGGSGTMANESFNYDTAKKLTTNAFSRTDYTFVGWATSANGPVLYSDEQSVKNLAGSGTVMLYAIWAQDVHRITVNIQSPQKGNVQIKLQQGNAVYAVENNVTLAADGALYKGSRIFDGIPAGVYNIVATQTVEGGKNVTVTKSVVLSEDGTVDIILPASGVNSELEVKEDTRPAVVGGLEEEAESNRQSGKDVTVKMTVEKQEEQQLAATANETDKATQDAISEIKATANGKTLEFMNIEIEKTTTDLGTSVSTSEAINETEKVLELVFSYEMNGKKNIQIYRQHGDAVQMFISLPAKPTTDYEDATFYVDTANSLIYVYAQQFSTYAIGYEEQSSGGGGGGSSYTVELPTNVKNGKVEVSPKNASAGQTVTLTVTPDKGFALETLTVLDKNGKEVEVKNLGNNKFSFTMPGGKVSISATFMEDSSMLNFFVDVKASDYFYDAVLWAAENGITKGTDAVHFSPNMGTTRAQVVTFLWRAAGCPEPKGDSSKFVDVPASEYYAKAVAWAIEQVITKGTSDTTFSPDVVCTRAQIVTFLARFAGVADEATGYTHGFTDVKATDYFNNAVAWAKDNKVTEGTSATTFSPNDDCTRAQVVTFLYRWMVK